MNPSTSAEYLDARRHGPVLPSYAQNAEDIRLWRVLGHRRSGFYVDVGAGDPVVDSVTKLFYDHGWSGINIEPGPRFEGLTAERTRDVNLDLAISSHEGTSRFWVSEPESSLSSLIEPTVELPEGITTEARDVRTRRLDQVLEEHAAGRSIDFLKVDTEGGERDVLQSFDPGVTRPTVIVVEAISPLENRPNHESWESRLLDAGYVFAAFDGVNRFYVPIEHEELVDALAYPISILDRYVMQSAAPSAGAVVDQSRVEQLERSVEDARRELDETRSTISWRITKPLRSVRRTQRRGLRAEARKPLEALVARDKEPFESAFVARLEQVLDLVSPASKRTDDAVTASSVESALARLELVAAERGCPADVLSWLALTAISGSYPDPREIASLARLVRSSGPHSFVLEVQERFRTEIPNAPADAAGVDVVLGGIIVDATQVVTSDLHSGIQRVARETLAHWLTTYPAIRLAYFDNRIRALKLLDETEYRRVSHWREFLDASEQRVSSRAPIEASGRSVIPWSSRLILLELPEPERCLGLRSVTSSSSIATLSMVGYDLIPIIAPETASTHVFEMFQQYLSVVKRAERLSAISQQSAETFETFSTLLGAAGEAGPIVRGHPLPTVRSEVTYAELASARASLRLGGLPLVLVVGLHDERKNHAAVVEAALRLWMQGSRFELLLVTGSDVSGAPEFDRYARFARSQGLPLTVKRRATERELWAAYNLARFTVFPSFIEGFGLPVAESLVSGTPAITSNFGSMAEIGADGGVLLVDPRDVGDLERQMHRLLTDDELLERLREEARARDFGSWERYAHDVWSFLVDEQLAADS